tara:strand:- start:417 stop:548 length:132 start_codon:yes stop_codon:yes gene_type:complete
LQLESAEILFAIARFVDLELLQAHDPGMAERLAVWHNAILNTT